MGRADDEADRNLVVYAERLRNKANREVAMSVENRERARVLLKPFELRIGDGDIQQLHDDITTALDAAERRVLERAVDAKLENTEMDKATEIPMSDCGLSINVGRDGVWLHFQASTGRASSLHVATFAEARGFVTKSGLLDWCVDREKQAAAIRALVKP